MIHYLRGLNLLKIILTSKSKFKEAKAKMVLNVDSIKKKLIVAKKAATLEQKKADSLFRFVRNDPSLAIKGEN